jgi:hypothetical protein
MPTLVQVAANDRFPPYTDQFSCQFAPFSKDQLWLRSNSCPWGKASSIGPEKGRQALQNLP